MKIFNSAAPVLNNDEDNFTFVQKLQKSYHPMVSVGINHTLLLNSEGEVYSFGNGKYGKLGHGNEKNVNIPTKIQGITSKIKQAAAGYNHSLFLTEEGDVLSCGEGSGGQLGHGNEEYVNIPTKIQGIQPKIVQVEAGDLLTLLLDENGKVHSCGANYYGELGYSTTEEPRSMRLTQIQGDMSDKVIVQIATGGYHVLLLDDNGCVHSYGKGENGQLGHANNDDLKSPTKIEPLINIIQVAAGPEQSLFLDNKGDVYKCGAWDGHENKLNTPTKIEINEIVHIAVSGNKFILVAKDGSVYSDEELLPLANTDMLNILNQMKMPLLTNTGDMFAHGINQILDLRNRQLNTPKKIRKIEKINNIIQVAAGKNHTLFLAKDGRVHSYGKGESGQLGHGDNNDLNTPKQIADFYVFMPELYCEVQVPAKTMLTAFESLQLQDDDAAKNEIEIIEPETQQPVFWK